MSLEESTLTLGGETREVKNLDFFKLGEVGKTDSKGVTSVVCGEYTFFVTADSLSFRHKPAKARASKPLKTLKSFKELDSLTIGEPPSEENKTKNTSAQSTEEEIKMAKLQVEGKEIEIPANVDKVLKKLGVKNSVVQINEFDDAVAKAKDADLVTLTGFEETINEAIKQGAPVKEAAKADAVAQTTQTAGAEKAADAPAADPLKGSSLFSGQQGAGAGAGAGAGRRGTRPQKTEEERERERLERKRRQEQERLQIKETHGRIEEIRSKQESIADGKEAIDALRELMIIDGRVPLFKTLVPSDTRLRAEVKNLIKPADRQYHPSLQNNPEYKKKGKDIEAKYAAGLYQVNLRESNPSQPSGFFIYIPECLMDLVPSKLSLHLEREKVLRARESGNRELVIKYFPKQEMILLLAALDAEVVEYNVMTNRYKDFAPHIYLRTQLDKETGVPVLSLRAKDYEGKNTKLSIRNFIPLSTHDTIKTTSADFDAQLTTDALFKRILFTKPEGAPADKFSQLTQESADLFLKKEDGTVLYTQFNNSETVDAYDSTTNRPQKVEVPLPKVVMSNPQTPGAVARPVFSKSKHTEPGYANEYKAAVATVGDQINKPRRQTNKSVLADTTEVVARMQAVLGLLEGEQIKVK